MGSGRVFQASRWTRGNFFFPDRLRLEAEAVVFIKRHLVGSEEESIRYEQIASVSVQRGLVFADLMFETTGGSEPVLLDGLWIGEAERAKAELQRRSQTQTNSHEERMLAILKEQTELLRKLVRHFESKG